MSNAPSTRPRLRTWKLVLLGVAWLGVIAFCFWTILNHDFAPAAAGTPPVQWPEDSLVSHASGLPTIVLVGHPHCPCTRASLEELAILMARVHNRATADVIFVHPHDFSDDWEKTDLWDSAARIPGVTVWDDLDGVEAARFGAQASGQTMFYAADGTLKFSGGIVPFRGHEGDNLGVSSIFSLVSTGRTSTTRTSVYGCSLRDPERAFTKESR